MRSLLSEHVLIGGNGCDFDAGFGNASASLNAKLMHIIFDGCNYENFERDRNGKV